MFLKVGSLGGTTFPARKVVVGTSQKHTTALINRNTELRRQGQVVDVVHASNRYPILDFAISNTQRFNAKVGSSDVKVSLRAFVSLMRYLNFAIVSGSSLVVTLSPPPRISMTMVQNSDANKITFDQRMVMMYRELGVNHMEQISSS